MLCNMFKMLCKIICHDISCYAMLCNMFIFIDFVFGIDSNKVDCFGFGVCNSGSGLCVYSSIMKFIYYICLGEGCGENH